MKKTAIFLGHLLALMVVFAVFFTAAAYFLFQRGLIGVDSNHFLYYVVEFSNRHLTWPPAGWKMDWYEGMAQMIDNPYLAFILIQPLVKVFGALMATKIFSMFFIFLFVVFSYLFFWELSGSILLSTALVIALSRSYALYVQLYSAGVGLSSCAQLASPAGFYFLLKFLKERKRHWLVLAIIAISIGFYIHNLLAIFFVFPFIFLFFLFYPTKEGKFFNRQKLKDILFFTLVTACLSLSAFGPFILDFFLGGQIRRAPFVPLGKTSDIMIFLKSTHSVFYIFLPLAIITAIFLGDFKRKIKLSLSFTLVLLYLFVFHITAALGINPLIGQIFAHRAFWPLPLLLGGLIALFLGRTRKFGLSRKIMVGLLALALLGASIWGDFPVAGDTDQELKEFSPGVRDVLRKGLPRYEVRNLFYKIDELVNWRDFSLASWKTDDLNYRISNYSQRIFWNIFYPMPQIQGYYHYRTYRADNWFAWFYAVFSRENFDEGGIPADIAQQQSLFLADWYAVRYIATVPSREGEVAPHFYQDDVPYVLTKDSTQAPAKIELSTDFVSEIARPTRVPVIGFVGKDQAYDNFLRNLGMLNLNSYYLIPIRLANFVEDLNQKKLEGIDGLVVYDYYKKKENSKAYQEGWQRVGDFVQKGGVVFIESGAECPEKWGEVVPEIFPVSQFESGSLGTNWEVESNFFEKADFENLSPLTYEDGFWSVSFAPSESSLKPGIKVLLRQANKPVVVERLLGQGKIIWSGLNLFYRPLHHQETALAEVGLLRKILGELVGLEKEKIEFDFNRPTPERVILSFTGGHGVLFKENNYGGWIAQAIIDGRKIRLPILSAGPDFMYAPLPKEFWNQSVRVEFIYQGLWSYWLFFLISVFTFVFLLLFMFLGQKLFNFTLLPLKEKILHTRKTIKGKWDEEE